MRTFLVLAVILLIFTGCDNIGEDPLPSPGPNADGSVTLFVNGSLYNFDYTAQYDGIQLFGYVAPTPDGRGGAFSNLGTSVNGGGFSGKEGSIYSIKGDKVLEFSHDLRYNTPGGEAWNITLFDNPPILLSDYSSITFWAKYAWPPEAYENDSGTLVFPQGKASVTISVGTRRGYSIPEVDIECTFTEEDIEDGQWRKFSVPLEKFYTVANPESNDPNKQIKIPIPPDDTLKSWTIYVPENAGRIYVDEIILIK